MVATPISLPSLQKKRQKGVTGHVFPSTPILEGRPHCPRAERDTGPVVVHHAITSVATEMHRPQGLHLITEKKTESRMVLI